MNIKQLYEEGVRVFSGLGLAWSDFTGADLSYSDFIGCDLRGVNLRGADLIRCDFTGADLEGSDLSNADLTDVDFTDVDLAYCDLRYTDLTKANLTGVFLLNTTGDGVYIKNIELEDNIYNICYTKDCLSIGCQQHSIDKWKSFTDDEIKGMDDERDALGYWNRNKKPIFDYIEKNPAKGVIYI